MFSLNDMLDTLQVEQLDKLLFRANSLPMPLASVFGGQVLAQALNAATRTVEPNRRAHSLHGYFLRPGIFEQPIIYDVDPIRDGGSFTTRRVVAKQNGKAIFNCSISFQIIEEGLSHQVDLPLDVPPPESLERDCDRLERLLAEGKGEGYRRPFVMTADTIDTRSYPPRPFFDPQPSEPVAGFWFKLADRLDDNPVTHQTMLAFVSDWSFMSTGLRPHGIQFNRSKFQGASLDHGLWFHSDFRTDEWLYYHMDSPRSAHARNFNRGSVYTRDGVLVASAVQEGLMRLKD